MEGARVGRKVAAAFAAVVLGAGACALACAPGFAHADTNAGTQIAVVQGTLPIDSDEAYDATLKATGYTARTSVQPLSADGEAGDAPASSPLLCGTPFTSRVPEGLAHRSFGAETLALKGEQPVNYQVGDTRTFFADGREPEGFSARVVAIGDNHTIWIEEGYDLFTDDELAQFATELDRAIAQVHEAFGTTERLDFDGDGKVAFVFHRFSEEMDYAAGYLDSVDLYTEEEWEQEPPEERCSYSNCLDMLHLNTVNASREDGTKYFSKDMIMLTLVHEFQHLVSFAQAGGTGDTWLEETFAQAAVGVTGLGEGMTSFMNHLFRVINNAQGVPFIFEGYYVPQEGISTAMSNAIYAQWYLFSRYLANQTEGFESPDGRLAGGDRLYKSVYDYQRDDEGLGANTTEHLIRVLEEIGYMGEGGVVRNRDELLANYHTAVLVRDTTGPYSLTNDPKSNPSFIDGATLVLVEMVEGAVPEAVRGGGAAVYVEMDRAELVRERGEGVQERMVDSPLPLTYTFEFSPPSESAVREGSLISVSSPQLALVDGSRLQYFFATEEEYNTTSAEYWVFQEYSGPLAFDPDRPIIGVRLVCDRGETFGSEGYFSLEASPSAPGEGEDPGSDPGFGAEDVPGLPGEPKPLVTGDGHEGVALAPTGDPLATASVALVALAAVSVLAIVAGRRRRDCRVG